MIYQKPDTGLKINRGCLVILEKGAFNY